jgi:hypothetical protein
MTLLCLTLQTKWTVFILSSYLPCICLFVYLFASTVIPITKRLEVILNKIKVKLKKHDLNFNPLLPFSPCARGG